MKKIKLTQGKQAIVDDADYEWLNQWRWYYRPDGYAARKVTKNKKTITILMHRQIVGTPSGMETDHINMNKLDNRRSNLRICTHAENNMNRGIASNSTSGYKGVSWHKDAQKWMAYIVYKDKRKYLGLHKTAERAAKAYDKAAKKYFGDFAWLNFS